MMGFLVRRRTRSTTDPIEKLSIIISKWNFFLVLLILVGLCDLFTFTNANNLKKFKCPEGVPHVEGEYLIKFNVPTDHKEFKRIEKMIKQMAKKTKQFNRFSLVHSSHHHHHDKKHKEKHKNNNNDIPILSILNESFIDRIECNLIAYGDNSNNINTISQTTTTQNLLNWGIDRVFSSRTSMDGVGRSDQSFDGTGTHIYIFDSGIRTTHSDFIGRIDFENSRNFVPVNSSTDEIDATDFEDRRGHGSHVSGIAAGTVFGVATKATIHAVKILDDLNGASTYARAIDALNWIISQKQQYPNRVIIINLSLSGGASDSLDEAVNATIAAGIHVVMSAGNDGTRDKACSKSPTRVSGPIRVGATDQTDTRRPLSNWGGCVDIFAPGGNILSDASTSDTATQTLSGTSMSTPFVTGAVSLLGQMFPTYNPQKMKSLLLEIASKNILNDTTALPNIMMFLPDNTCPWSDWDTCSVQCGTGTQQRTRSTTNTTCWGGGLTQQKQCAKNCTIIPCTWGAWNSWSDCKLSTGSTCGTGIITRTRTGSSSCNSSDAYQTSDCYVRCTCSVSQWSDWGTCTSTSSQSGCVGTQKRTRSPIGQTSSSTSCIVDNTISYSDSKSCTIPCSVCSWLQWSDWSVCTLPSSGPTCGATGTQKRLRTATVVPCTGSADGLGNSDSRECVISCSDACNNYIYYKKNTNEVPQPLRNKVIGCSKGANVTVSQMSFTDILRSNNLSPDWVGLANEYIAAKINLMQGCTYDENENINDTNSMFGTMNDKVEASVRQAEIILQDCDGWSASDSRRAGIQESILSNFNNRSNSKKR